MLEWYWHQKCTFRAFDKIFRLILKFSFTEVILCNFNYGFSFTPCFPLLKLRIYSFQYATFLQRSTKFCSTTSCNQSHWKKSSHWTPTMEMTQIMTICVSMLLANLFGTTQLPVHPGFREPRPNYSDESILSTLQTHNHVLHSFSMLYWDFHRIQICKRAHTHSLQPDPTFDLFAVWINDMKYYHNVWLDSSKSADART